MTQAVKLVAITKPQVESLETAADLISYCARVSNPSNQMNTSTSAGLLNYCIKHKHFSIFEMANMVVEINTTRDISRQILRHRSFSYQEFSGRYSKMPEQAVLREARIQDPKNKQNSIVCDDEQIINDFQGSQSLVWQEALRNYNLALEAGIAKEQARALLPEGMTKTRMYMNGTIRSWIHYCLVRCGVETQKEHRLIAKEVCKLLIEQMPFLQDTLGKCLEEKYSAEV